MDATDALAALNLMLRQQPQRVLQQAGRAVAPSTLASPPMAAAPPSAISPAPGTAGGVDDPAAQPTPTLVAPPEQQQLQRDDADQISEAEAAAALASAADKGAEQEEVDDSSRDPDYQQHGGDERATQPRERPRKRRPASASTGDGGSGARGRGRSASGAPPTCTHCGTTQTPRWWKEAGPNGTLCNACGIWSVLHRGAGCFPSFHRCCSRRRRLTQQLSCLAPPSPPCAG